MNRFLIFSVVTLMVSGFSQQSSPTQTQNVAQTAAPAAERAAEGAVLTSMRNVDFHLTDRIIVHIVKLDGKLTHVPDKTVVFDDKTSFGIDVNSANVSMSTTALSNDLNDYVFSRADSPVKKLSASTQGNLLTLKGLLVSKGGVPFESSGSLSVTPDGMIRVHTTKIKVVHVPVKGLMDMLGLDTANLLSTKKVPGVYVDKDDLILDAQLILPPPNLRGHLTGINVENEAIALTFGPGANDASQPVLTNSCGARNYLQFKGGTVRFGKLTMTDADLLLMDMQPADPFDFSIDHYKEQLAAGYAKSTQQGGLCVHMPDFDKIKPAK